jgi:tRNA nucleotidyltransferase (CCA-adding enzyme)
MNNFSNSPNFYLVGGCVRDEILGHKPNDIDYAIEAPSFEVMKRSLSNHKIFVEKPEFGTIKAKCPKSGIVADYTLCRKESGYTDHRRPDSISVANIYEDLSRRDFTMNAIAKLRNDDGTFKYYDPFGGKDDIKKRKIVCVGSARERITEDPLRGLRALRFSITKGFEIHQDILDVIQTDDFFKAFETLSTERVYEELKKMLVHDTIGSMKLLTSLGDRWLNVLFGSHTGIWLQPTLKIR